MLEIESAKQAGDSVLQEELECTLVVVMKEALAALLELLFFSAAAFVGSFTAFIGVETEQ